MSNCRVPQERESCYEVVEATMTHVAELAPRMRAADVEEVAVFGHTPLEALTRSVKVSRDAYAGLVNGRVICMFGVSSPTLMSDEGSPWLLGSDEIVRHAKVFLRLNRLYIAGIRRQYRVLHNFVGARNVAAIRWLGWLGFSISEHCQTIGDQGVEMIYFEMRRLTPDV